MDVRLGVDVGVGVDHPSLNANGNVFYGCIEKIGVIVSRLMVLGYMMMLRPVAVLLLKVSLSVCQSVSPSNTLI